MSTDPSPAPPSTPPTGSGGRTAPHGRGFILLLAACMGISALSIDLLLPAFADMRSAFGLPTGSTRISLVITAYFIGMGVGQIFYGPASDRFGRKPAMYAGIGLFVVATTAAVFTTSLEAMLVCRVLWGLGAAAPRSLALAVARDVYRGDRLTRAMSLIMAIYIVVPMFAPLLGAAVLVVGPWELIVVVQLAYGVALALWLRRLPETLAPEHRRSISIRPLFDAARAVLRCRPAVGYMLAVTAVYGIMISYIGGIEVIIDEVLGHGDVFAFLFSAVAVGLVAGSLTAARVVGRLGTGRLLRIATTGIAVLAVAVAIIGHGNGGHPNTAVFLGTMSLLLYCATIIVPAANAAALEPLGHVAGMAAGIVGVVSTVGAAGLGALSDAAFDGTAGPFTLHVLAYALVAFVSTWLVANDHSARTARRG